MDLHDAALSYAEREWSVFPLRERSKYPLITAAEGGHGLYDATTDPNQIRLWWTERPNANIGLRTGMAFDVIDLDGKEAAEALSRARSGRERVHGPVVATAHGFHIYVLPTGLGNRARFLPGIDFRGAGGYVVGPPSVHPDGAAYRWITPPDTPLSPVPAWLMDVLAPERSQAPRAVPEQPVANSTAYGQAALRRELERLSQAQEGERNNQLNRSSFAMGQLIGAGALDGAETAVVLSREGQRLGLSLREAERTVASGINAGMGQPRAITR